MSNPDIGNQIRIQPHNEYWFTVEDFYWGVGCDGLTISSWEYKDGKETRVKSISIEESSALAVADAIYKLFKKEDN